MNWLTRNFWRLYLLTLVSLVAFGIGRAFGSDYTRDGGTADWQCCADKACTTVISQHADPVRARDACGKLTDADGKTRWTSSNAFRITPSAGTKPPVPPTPPAPTLAYATTAGGTYANLQGANVSGAISVRLAGDCATAFGSTGPWTFSVDDVARNTEAQCPYALIDDNALFDTTTLANGSHTVTAVSGAATVLATFTVANAAPPPPPPPPPPATGSATLTWVAPTTNTDGSALTNLAGYRICRGSNATSLTDCRPHMFPTATTATWTGLASGTHWFAVRAVNAAGAESVLSNAMSKVVP